MCTQHKDSAHLRQEDRFRIETLFTEQQGFRQYTFVIYRGHPVSHVTKDFFVQGTQKSVSAFDPSSWFCLLAKHHCAFTKRKKRRRALLESRFVTPRGIEPRFTP